MAKVNIIRWDDTNYLSKLLDSDDTAMVNAIDVTGSAGNLSLGPTDADSVLLGKTGGSLVMSGSSFFKANALWEDDILAIFGTSADTSVYYDSAEGNLVLSGSDAASVHVFGTIFSASTGAKITGSVDLPGQTSFLLDGVAVTTEKYTAVNLSRLFNGSNVDDLHSHAIASASLTSSLLIDADLVGTYRVGGPAGSAVTGTQVVYLSGGANLVQTADADDVITSRLIGVVSGSTAATYASGSEVPIYTFYGDRFGGFTGLTPSSVYYLSSTPGAITTTPPVGNGRNIVQVGIATSVTEFLFQPNIVVRGLG
jgi:hypothetical protein